MASTISIERHPDIVALRQKYEQVNETWAAHVVTGLVLLSGLYLAISPWVVGFQSLAPLAISNIATGAVLVALACGLTASFERWHGVTWVIPVLGIWAFVSPWVIRGTVNTTPAVASNVSVGAVTAVLGAATLYLSMRRMRR
ncbi:VIT1/CCC1 family predicted Fe2+/Mn2+ transporter [Hamadaea flava]|uniref:SPW repeat protein n=1 Tax=Hamadaea flava TaxID=1742688 RepID=A0ABV8LRC7_9ACTN|nr:SPW repeat protein [Hamadaea flava]MCP2328745.1 VIT1/CCC1 family predicted Fe2+/Mn2+ transporter [Hamadaea flava]